jgi:hypothetical protein
MICTTFRMNPDMPAVENTGTCQRRISRVYGRAFYRQKSKIKEEKTLSMCWLLLCARAQYHPPTSRPTLPILMYFFFFFRFVLCSLPRKWRLFYVHSSPCVAVCSCPAVSVDRSTLKVAWVFLGSISFQSSSQCFDYIDVVVLRSCFLLWTFLW